MLDDTPLITTNNNNELHNNRRSQRIIQTMDLNKNRGHSKSRKKIFE